MSQDEIKYSIVGAGFVPGLPAIITRSEAAALGKEILGALDAAIASGIYAEYIASAEEPAPVIEDRTVTFAPAVNEPAAPKPTKKKE